MAVLYAVRRKVLDEYSRNDIPKPEEQYLGTFTTRAAAEEYARQYDRETKQSLPLRGLWPFHFAEYEQLTSLPPFALRDWLRDEGIDPPPVVDPKQTSEGRAWEEWWDRTAKADSLTPAQCARVWAGLNLYTLFEVEEVDAEQKIVPQRDGVVYAVVHRHWEYDDCHYCGSNDGLAVYRTKARAEEEVRRLERDRTPLQSYWNGGPNEYVVVELINEGED